MYAVTGKSGFQIPYSHVPNGWVSIRTCFKLFVSSSACSQPIIITSVYTFPTAPSYTSHFVQSGSYRGLPLASVLFTLLTHVFLGPVFSSSSLISSLILVIVPTPPYTNYDHHHCQPITTRSPHYQRKFGYLQQYKPSPRSPPRPRSRALASRS